ncbi:hypothetical protein AVEN_129866-1 [Araneus ventricosus]|uniref:Uncharacterized protein n=1 Tax=Araneus ventricosus TaxID=182803 RepID=A0A4Y2V5X2_ARAVE|nr:hypothetical protein AVEN_129866-1 [Araneus ventricosus]
MQTTQPVIPVSRVLTISRESFTPFLPFCDFRFCMRRYLTQDRIKFYGLVRRMEASAPPKHFEHTVSILIEFWHLEQRATNGVERSVREYLA